MTEQNNEELEGFDDLDGLLDEDPGGGDDDGFSGELDDFLSADDDGGGDLDAGGDDAGGDDFGGDDLDAGGDDAGGDDFGGDDLDAGGDDDFGLGDDFGDDGGNGEEGDSELDSFFEDLSTIDDLEVSQQDAPAESAQEMPADDGGLADDLAAAAPVAAVAAAVAAPAAAKDKKKRPWLKRLILLILLGLVVGSGYYAYSTLFPEGESPPWAEIPVPELPWPLVEGILENAPLGGQQAKETLPGPAPTALEKPAAPPAPAPSAPVAAGPPPASGKGYGVQVATCFFSKCVKGFERLLARNNRTPTIATLSQRSESLEIISGTVFNTRDVAEQTARRINAQHRLEGLAYIVRSGEGFKISMGTFPDLSRASLVRDSLNQRLEGEVFFTSRLKTQSFKMSKVVTGRYASAAEARKELLNLRNLDSQFKGAFIVRN